MSNKNHCQIGKILVDTYTQKEALQAIKKLIGSTGGNVFTPNVDHIVLAEENKAFADAYDRASIKVADGMPLVWASRFLACKIPERVAGSDLLLPLLRLAYEHDWSVYLLGSSPETIQIACRKLDDMFPALRIVGHSSPMVSSNPTKEEVAGIIAPVVALRPHLVIVALGAPKQELFMDKAIDFCPGSVMLGLGASLDFIAGKVQRAPRLLRSLGLEWFWRLCQEPKRLWRRYYRDLKFPFIIYRNLNNK